MFTCSRATLGCRRPPAVCAPAQLRSTPPVQLHAAPLRAPRRSTVRPAGSLAAGPRGAPGPEP